MFGFFSSEEVVPVSLIEGLLTFHSSKKQNPGKTIKVKLVLATQGQVETPTVKVLIADCKEQPGGSFLCSGVLKYKESKLPDLVLKMARAGVDGASRRQSKRYDFVARILSKELLNFRAVALNVNLHGALIQTDGAVAPGDYMNLEFDLSSVGMRKLTMQATCIWCRPDPERDKNTYSAGVAFTEQHEATHHAWGKLYAHLKANENSSVMMKTMAGSTDDAPPSAQVDAVAKNVTPLGTSAQAPDLPDVKGGFGSQAVKAPQPVNRLSVQTGPPAAPAAPPPPTGPPSFAAPTPPPQTSTPSGFGSPSPAGPPNFAPPTAPSFGAPAPPRTPGQGISLGNANERQNPFGSAPTSSPGLQFPPPSPSGSSPGLQFPPPTPGGQQASPGLQFPPPKPATPGLQFPPPNQAHRQAQSPGLQFPPPAPGHGSGQAPGLQLPQQNPRLNPGTSSPGLQFPPPGGQQASPGLQFPPPPPGGQSASPGLQFPPPAPGGQQASPGLQFPPPPPAAPNNPAPGLQFPPPKPQENQPGLQFPPPPPPGNWS